MDEKNKAAQSLAKLSVAARQRKWGKKGFTKKMQQWGKLGGRPESNPCSKYPSHRYSPKTGKCYGCGATRKIES